MSSKSKAPKQEVSESTKQQARAGVRSWNEHITDGYAELEQKAIAAANNNHQTRLQGMAAADTAGAGMGLNQNLGVNGPTSVGNAERETAIAKSRSKMMTDATSRGIAAQDAQRLNAVNTGAGKASQSNRALNVMSQLDTSKGLSDIQNQMTKDAGRMQGAMSVVKGGVLGYLNRESETETPVSPKTTGIGVVK